jgi:hypothetical protein
MYHWQLIYLQTTPYMLKLWKRLLNLKLSTDCDLWVLMFSKPVPIPFWLLGRSLVPAGTYHGYPGHSIPMGSLIQPQTWVPTSSLAGICQRAFCIVCDQLLPQQQYASANELRGRTQNTMIHGESITHKINSGAWKGGVLSTQKLLLRPGLLTPVTWLLNHIINSPTLCHCTTLSISGTLITWLRSCDPPGLHSAMSFIFQIYSSLFCIILLYSAFDHISWPLHMTSFWHLRLHLSCFPKLSSNSSWPHISYFSRMYDL